ncbi:MAG: outer membrane beta-barrel protein [Saprospiraceae bacterium]|nr:outer membrane beta-barrel protein [Saprospiraceae bacterium]
MLRIVRLFLLAFLCSPILISAQIDYPEDAYRDLRRGLEGTWFMPTDRGDRLEIWQEENDSTLTGRSVRIKPENGDTVLLERLRIELRDTTVTYIAIARGQNDNKPVAFVLTEIDDQGFYVFSNPKHDDPQKIKYLLLGNREIQVVTEGQRNGRTVTQEYVFEREFTPGAVEFRVKAGINAQTIRATGNFPSDPPDFANPAFDWKPGWEIGTQVRFKGRGGFITVNTELTIVGKATHATSAFTVINDSIDEYLRDVNYRTAWLIVGVYPEISFKRDGRFSIMAGPYYGRLMFGGGKGTVLPDKTNPIYEVSNDFKKNDLGLQGGIQYKLNFGKKDVGGIIGLRANLGLANLDNLYKRYCSDGNTVFCNGAIAFQGVSLYYSMDLLKF